MKSLLLGFCFVTATSSFAADWPQFLGPDRNGTAESEVTLLTTVPDSSVPIVWKKAVGAGFAGPVLSENLCFLFHREGHDVRVDAFDRLTGKVLWEYHDATQYQDSFGFDEGPRSCPTLADGRLFCYGADGVLTALDAISGKLLWKRDLAKAFEAPQGFFGRCSSPLVLGDQVLLDIGGTWKGKGANLVAFRVDTGDLVWALDDGEADYASPQKITLSANREIALFFTREGFTGVDPADGKALFQERFRSSIHASVNAASPIINGRRFFLTSSYGTGCGLWEVSEDGTSVKTLYKKTDQLDAHFGTPVLHGDYLYGFHGRQESGQALRCLRLDDASVQWEWQSPSAPAGSLLCINETLLVLSEKGELIAAPASEKAFTPIYRAQILGAECRALPAFADGYFFARDKKQLVCVDLRKVD